MRARWVLHACACVVLLQLLAQCHCALELPAHTAEDELDVARARAHVAAVQHLQDTIHTLSAEEASRRFADFARRTYTSRAWQPYHEAGSLALRRCVRYSDAQCIFEPCSEAREVAIVCNLGNTFRIAWTWILRVPHG